MLPSPGARAREAEPQTPQPFWMRLGDRPPAARDFEPYECVLVRVADGSGGDDVLFAYLDLDRWRRSDNGRLLELDGLVVTHWARIPEPDGV